MPVKFGFDAPMLNTWLLLHQTFDMILKVEEKEFARIGITPQYNGVLMALKYKKGKVTIKELANWLNKNSNSISTLIDRMQRDGYVERMESTRDRREVHVVMTEKGKEMAEQSDALGWKIVNDVLNGYPGEDLVVLNTHLEKIRDRALAQFNPDETVKEVKTTKNAGKMVRAKKKRQSKKA
jgi:DNA-binding MarR family transcriptional regulator